MYEPATDMLDFFNEIAVPMKCCTDPMPVDQMPSPERIAAVQKKHKMEVLESAWYGPGGDFFVDPLPKADV